ncbi:MAG: hypothetical protein K2M07_00605 [Muribaculaceae bacterium]|nr:hypothetical protein [Muribaculaceae bacterium]
MLISIIGISTYASAREIRQTPDEDVIILDKLSKGEKIILDSTLITSGLIDETVIVGDDTVSIIIPQKNYGRFDRGLYNFMFIPKGQWGFGLTASYGEFNTDDVQVLSILKDLDLKIKAYSIKPSISYFFDNNQSVGLQFNYSRTITDLSGLTVDFDEDINFSLRDVSYYSENYAASAFYRNYVGLGTMKRFAVFNEVELSFGSGTSRFKRIYNDEPRDTRTNSTTAALNFSPGICVFIMDNVSFNISFGVFGIQMKHDKQWVDGVKAGSRTTSGANFKFNIFNINFGMGVYI